MKKTYLVAAVAAVSSVAVAAADVVLPITDITRADSASVVTTAPGGTSTRVVTEPTVVYESNTGNATTAIGNDGAGSVYGDAVSFLDTGVLEGAQVDIWASSNNTGNILSGEVTVLLFDLAQFTSGDYATGLLGGFTGGFDLSGLSDPIEGNGLRPGFFTTLTYSGLSDIGIDVTTTDVVFVMQYNELVTTDASVGDAGTIIYDSTTVGAPLVNGAGTDVFYQDFAPAGEDGDADAGFYSFATLDGIVGASFTLTAPIPEPTSVALLGLGGLGLVRRRRA